MREDGPDDRPLGDPDGPPSARARADLRADLRREAADARLRLEEAGLRAETHRLLGDDRAAAEVVAEQERLLQDLERRLGRVVSAAVLQRDAEQVLAGATVGSITDDVDTTATEQVPARSPRRVPTLSGVASAVAVLAVAALAVVGVTDRPSRIEVLGAADTARTDQPTGTDAERPSQRPLPDHPVPSADPHDDADTRTDAAGPPSATAGTASAATSPSPEPAPESGPTDLPTDPSLDQLVAGLTDALRQLGDEVAPDAGTEGDTPVEQQSDDPSWVDELEDEPTDEPLDEPTDEPTEDDVDWFQRSDDDPDDTGDASTLDRDDDGGFVSDSPSQ